MSLPVGGHGSQKCEKLTDRIEAEVIASLVLIGQLGLRKFDDYIPEIECRHKARFMAKARFMTPHWRELSFRSHFEEFFSQEFQDC